MRFESPTSVSSEGAAPEIDGVRWKPNGEYLEENQNIQLPRLYAYLREEGKQCIRRVLLRNRGKWLQAKLMDVKNDLQRRSHPNKVTSERMKRLIYHWIPPDHTYLSPYSSAATWGYFLRKDPSGREAWAGIQSCVK